MKKVTFAILTVGVALFASCGGADNSAAEKNAKDSLELLRIADSTAKATAEAEAAAMTQDTAKADTAKGATPAAAATPAAH